MGWQRDVRLKAGGRWECREKRREYNARQREAKRIWRRSHPDSMYGTRRWASKRRWTLAREKERITERLIQLSEEVKQLAES